MNLEFRNLKYTVYNRILKGRGKNVLKGVHGRFQSGQLVAILGLSGAGKSSLLNAISGYRSAGVSGDLLMNGKPRNEQKFQSYSCYITQEDALQPFLTVREAMEVAARLKLPKGASPQVEQILKELGLLQHQHTKSDQLSSGEKKRLSIALELVNNPPVFFLDEPTSGLDIVTAVQCVKLLRQLARQGRMVICTIHQPSASLLEMFDQVYVMADGRCVFQGDTAALVPYLENIGLPCPKHHNPADFIIELTENPKNISKLCEAILNGKKYISEKLYNTSILKGNQVRNNRTEGNTLEEDMIITLMNEESIYKVPEYFVAGDSGSVPECTSRVDSTQAWIKLQKSAESFGYPTKFCEQFQILLHRMMIQIFRNRPALLLQVVHHLLSGVITGAFFFNIANDGTQMFGNLNLCLGVVLFFTYTQVMVPVLVFPQEVKLLKKEHFNRWYRLTSYYAALTVSRLPLQLTMNMSFCTIVYFMIGMPFRVPSYLTFCLIGNLVSLVAEGMGLAIGSVCNVTNGSAVGPSTMAPLLALAMYGYDFAPRITLAMKIFMKTSFLRCGLDALLLTVYGFGRKPLQCQDLYCHFAKPDVVFEFFDLKNSSILIKIAPMFGFLIMFRSLSYLGLRWRLAT